MATNAEILAILIPDLKFFEGEPGTSLAALRAYQDSVGVWTYAYGRTGPEVVKGATCTQAQADMWVIDDATHAMLELDLNLPWWRQLDAVRGSVYAQMTYIMGIGGTLEFHHMNAAAEEGEWLTASAELLASDLAMTDGNRIKIMAREMLDGVHVPPETVL